MWQNIFWEVLGGLKSPGGAVLCDIKFMLGGKESCVFTKKFRVSLVARKSKGILSWRTSRMIKFASYSNCA